ncbi:MAG: thiamine-phosphate kinase [Variovorax sp.]
MTHLSEFALIERYFTRRPGQPTSTGADTGSQTATAPGIAVGIGDDCALLAPAPGMQLAVSTDMLVEGRHFLSTVAPARLGHKALAVNLSDLAACGARPLAFTLSLSLPSVEESWLGAFSSGLFALADAHRCTLVGGDTTRGPLNISITVFGEVPAGAALLRSTARAGDDIWVSGSLGDARLALEVFRGTLALPSAQFETARARMETPTPRIALGQALRGIATAAIDISDGLVGDLGHILEASAMGATLNVDAVCALLAAGTDIDIELQRRCTLAGGDDYELCFTADSNVRDSVERAGRDTGTRVSRIGRVDVEDGMRLRTAGGEALVARYASFDHFAS